jgi:hypothetical protein
MTYPISTGADGVKIQPEKMEKEKLYHCVFNEKVLLFYKDDEDILNCYEVEEDDLVKKVKAISDKDELDKIFEEYLKQKNLNIK